MEVLIMAGQLLLALSILVGVHELGHMLSAKYFGMRVEKFSIGFPPKIFSFKIGETEYSLGAIPLGGFVKITGMIDESMDTENLNKEPQPYEFRSKPVWQRLIVMMGGIVVNVILGVLIFIALLWCYGEKYYSREEVNKNGIVAYELATKIGLKTGDKILQVNGKDFEKFPQDILTPEILLNDSSYYLIQRGTETLRVDIPKTFISDLSNKKAMFLSPAYPFAIGEVISGSPAEMAGLEKGDQILTANGTEVPYFQKFQEILAKNKGENVTLVVDRNGENKELVAKVDTSGKVGFQAQLLLKEESDQYPLAQAIPLGTERAFSVITNSVKAFGKMFKGDLNPSESVAGPLGIAKEFGGQWIWERFWILTGSLSMVLAFMNFLPIPALDGGHVMFLTYEMVAGRKPSDRFLENAQKIGMLLLLTLMVFVFGNDIYKMIVN
jgi:regulator of sigma E protease